MGGGGDVVGALATAHLAETLGVRAVLGGTTWERRVIDPLPGPRRLDEIDGAEPLSAHVALAGPDTTGPGGFAFAESRLAGVLGERTVLVDPTGGPEALAREIAEALPRLHCDAVALVDVGGDALAHGDEAGLASPLCDAILLAAGAALAAGGTPTVLGIVGAGCDGELTPAEVLDRVGEVAAGGGALGAWGITPEAGARIEAAVAAVPTEASAAALRCARGERGRLEIRGGRRTVQLTTAGGLTFYLDPAVAVGTAARLARAVAGARGLDEAQERLAALGVRTELDLERDPAS
ncbi:MAG TPA: DUF1152 domain-containing protein [Solirubrobacteraceae bacterium]|nr:DUF1152 domain-containing protein [Solirubrobacteraceae bacterium]